MSVRKLKEKVDSMTRVIEHLLNETNHLRELGIGTLETVKLLPGYDKAIEQLKKNMAENNEPPKLELEDERK